MSVIDEYKDLLNEKYSVYFSKTCNCGGKFQLLFKKKDNNYFELRIFPNTKRFQIKNKDKAHSGAINQLEGIYNEFYLS